jgi:hypothetical protein
MVRRYLIAQNLMLALHIPGATCRQYIYID